MCTKCKIVKYNDKNIVIKLSENISEQGKIPAILSAKMQPQTGSVCSTIHDLVRRAVISLTDCERLSKFSQIFSKPSQTSGKQAF